MLEPGTVGYRPAITRGKQLDNYLIWRLQADAAGAVEARLPKANLPCFLTTSVDGLNDNWSAYLLDRARANPNFRSLPIRDGRTFAQLDLNEADSDLFIGHPVTADQAEVRILVSWKEPGLWYVEAHNPGHKPMNLKLKANEGWNLFDFAESVELPPGASRVWTVKAK